MTLQAGNVSVATNPAFAELSKGTASSKCEAVRTAMVGQRMTEFALVNTSAPFDECKSILE